MSDFGKIFEEWEKSGKSGIVDKDKILSKTEISASQNFTEKKI